MDKKELQVNIGKRVRQLREERNISQSDLAAMCNFDKSNMSRIEAGNTSPTIYTLFKIATMLDVQLSELLTFPTI